VRAQVVDADALGHDAQPGEKSQTWIGLARLEVQAQAMEVVGAQARHHGDDDVAPIVLALAQTPEEARLRDDARQRGLDGCPQTLPGRFVAGGGGVDQALDLLFIRHAFLCSSPSEGWGRRTPTNGHARYHGK
jgi:hypothetical protein